MRVYDEVESRVRYMIEQGTFRSGDRLPSVRALSTELGVSINTVVKAYRTLEDEEILEARPQSGYFVRARFVAPEPLAISRPEGLPQAVTIPEVVTAVLQDTRDAHLVQLGTALPNTEVLPTEKLRRIVAHVGQRHQKSGIRYEAPPGNRSLRARIAKRALGAHCALGPDDILVTNSCQEALFLALSTVCRAGDMVAIESPAFFGVLRALERLELRAVEIHTHPQHGVELVHLADQLRRHPIRACILVTNFSNPLGCHMPDESKRELVKLLAEREVPLIEDDIYGDLGFAAARPSVAKAFDEKGLVILCSSFSKTIAPGYAVGWLSGGRFHEAISWNRTVINLTAAMLAQHVLDEFLAEGGYEHHLRRVRRLYAHQVAGMAEAIARHFPDGTRVTRPHGGFVLWVELPGGCDSVELYRRAVKQGVTLAPGPIFAPGDGFRNFIRLSAAHWNPSVKAAIRTIGSLVM